MIKKKLKELAIFGGKPTFEDALHVGRPNIGDRQRFMKRLNDILDRRWLTNRGPYVRELEGQLADFLGTRHCIAMCNATVALEIVARAIGISEEVIVPSFTFIATAHALQWQEITPVFSDVDPSTHNLDPNKVERMITPRTTGIIGVHIWGRSCAVEGLSEIAERHNLKLIFDAAHAFGCSHNGQMIGNFGEAEIFSFHATKFINTFEGGAVATNSDELAKRIRLMQNFGFAGLDNVIYIGTNGKMSEISAAMGLTSLEYLDEIEAINYRNYRHYRNELDSVTGLEMVIYDETENNNFQYIVLEINRDITDIGRDDVVNVLHKENIRARRYFFPGCHRMEPYRSYFPHAGLMLPKTEELTDRIICLPTGSSINIAEIDIICQTLRFIIDNGSTISEHLHR